jgi:hypothetical protein
VRNRIYGHLFSNNTIHIDVTIANRENESTLCIDLCTTPSNDHAYFSGLTGAVHVLVKEENEKDREQEAAKEREEEAAKPVQSIDSVSRPAQSGKHKGREVCDSNRMLGSHMSCGQTVQLSTQFLRTCRQVYLDAALLPYSTNTFNFSGGLHDTFCAVFVQKFSATQRRAMQTAIVDASAVRCKSALKCVQKIPDLLPGLKHLWLISRKSWDWNLEQDYARVKLPSLIGVVVQLGERLGESTPPWLDAQGEYLEWALLDNIALSKEALLAKWDSGEMTRWGWRVRTTR